MAKRKRSPKNSIATLLFLLAFVAFYNINKSCEGEKHAAPAPREYREPAKKTGKAKQVRRNRKLTTFTGKVVGVKDGDTFDVLYDSIPERVRLAEIDCPEKSQAFGNNAKQFASDLCFGKVVTVTNTGRDRYGRIVGKVITQDGINVNEALVKAGLAWHYTQYSKDTHLGEVEAMARQQRVGLWADKKPVPPWDYRKQKRTKKKPKTETAVR